MSKLLVHFPVVMALAAAAFFAAGALFLTYWLIIPAWQALCVTVMLILDGKNRMKRFRRIVCLLERGIALDSLPREGTICGFFIRMAALKAKRPVSAG